MGEIEIIVNGQKIKISATYISGFIYLEIKDAANLVGREFSFNEEK
ncbi:hypothetical protein [Peptoniphilus raoultii]|nr:hypothetical protein [Peptoniphilus raoultii]